MWQVEKRDSNLQTFQRKKITHSIIMAQKNIDMVDEELARELSLWIVRELREKYGKENVISTADIGDMVERILIEEGQYDIAKAYILSREKQRQERRAGRGLGVKDDLGLSYNQLVVIANKYLRKNEEGNIIETPKQMFERVAKALASAEKNRPKHWEKQFYKMMSELRFLPGGRTLANAGTVNNQLANCFVMPMPDSVEGIFDVVKESSILKKNGGGVGFSLGRIRPKGDLVATTTGRAAGPVAIMSILNHASEMLLQAGGRRSGNMVVLPVSHPDVFEFLTCKQEDTVLNHINFSLALTSKFMQAVEKDGDWDLVNPRNGEIVNTVSAHSIFDLATTMAWRNGDPGIIFIDEINKYNPTPQIGAIESVNLCGEQPLLPYEACNLGSINLSKHLKENRAVNSKNRIEIDWEKLKETVRLSVRMLDDVVSICTYPLQKVTDTVKANRKIGLGVMGWADMLVKLGIPYNSDEALVLAEKIAKFIQDEGLSESQNLAREKGAFPNWQDSLWQQMGRKPQRNATITTIAPTGSIAMAAGCSYGIEPHFALAFYKQAMGGYKLPEINQDLMNHLEKLHLDRNGVVDEVLELGTIQHIKKIPENIRQIFLTAHDLKPEDHIKMQAAWQKHTDNAVSKTINLSADATVDDVKQAFILAWKLKCKGLTVYRDSSRLEQVLNIGKKVKSQKLKIKTTNASKKVQKVQNTQCPQCGGVLTIHEGCKSCSACGFSACSV
ncbi:adenosylcobalamin-dependent ribonucleoside-diphosphate reductase [Candidatus Beckwithbacteria bacterium]|nr:adenosylcobalamin-dependent ribonucleoside-diphosphate reductase [Candidatus Beckwithbacteria bacterium]